MSVGCQLEESLIYPERGKYIHVLIIENTLMYSYDATEYSKRSNDLLS